MTAPATTAPDASVTVPEIVAVVTCADSWSNPTRIITLVTKILNKYCLCIPKHSPLLGPVQRSVPLKGPSSSRRPYPIDRLTRHELRTQQNAINLLQMASNVKNRSRQTLT